MNDEEIRIIYKSQVVNVRALKASMKHVHRSVNEAIRTNKKPELETYTKIYAILFCGWAEANFSKILHTPKGFYSDEIKQISDKKSQNIAEGWKKCVELGLRRTAAKNGSFRPNVRRKLFTAINSHVVDPAVLRNRLAHGQWINALNSKNTAVQADLTQSIDQLDVVKVLSWVNGHELMADVVERLIVSPKKAFAKDWYSYIASMEEQLEQAESRTFADHERVILERFARTGGRQKRKAFKSAPL